MAQYQAYLHSNRVNWLVFHHKMSKFHHKMSKFHHEMSKFHHKCPNSIIIPCKFRFLDEKIKLEDQQVGISQHSQSHPKNDKSSPLFGTLNNLKTTIYVFPNSCLVARDRIKVGKQRSQLQVCSSKAKCTVGNLQPNSRRIVDGPETSKWKQESKMKL